MALKEDQAIELILQYGDVDGAHHKQWLIDQVLRVLAGDRYDALIAEYETPEPDEQQPDEFAWYNEWDKGVAP